MTELKDRLNKILLTNNAWILVLAIIIICFNWVLIFRVESTPRLQVYLHPDKWVLFIKMVGAMCLLFSPMIGYAMMRERIAKLPTARYLWGVVFLVWPIMTGLSHFFAGLMPMSIQGEVLSIFGFIILAVELLTKSRESHGYTDRFMGKLKKVNLDWYVLGFVILMSFAEAFKLIIANNWNISVWQIWPQTLVSMLVMFAFYLVLTRYVLREISTHSGIIYLVSAILLTIVIFYPIYLSVWTYLPMNQQWMHTHDSAQWIGEDAPRYFRSFSHQGFWYGFVFFATPVALFVHWIRQSQRIKTLENDKTEAELDLLKQQINPHFFFNTLNNVYALSLSNQQATSEGILQLSDLMRYVIYRGAEEQVTLREDVEYINNFIALQRLRLSDRVTVNIDVDIVDQEQNISPMLLIVLIENAFKHSVDKSEDPIKINILLQQQERTLYLRVINTYVLNVDSSNGIGLQNLRRRLDLIYSDRYSLQYGRQGDEYVAELMIKQ